MQDQSHPALYNMKLHDSIQLGENLWAMRVPGGWIYEMYIISHKEFYHTFVPYNTEFK